MNDIHIIITDDHRLVRDGIKSLLQNEPGIKVIAEAENGEELMHLLTTITPDILLIDLTMPKLNGIQATEKIKALYPHIGIIILSMHEEPEYVIKCIEAGADSYLLKNVEKSEIIKAINKVMTGEKFFNADVSLIMAKGLTLKKNEDKEQIDITEKEMDVLKDVALGLSTKQIADKQNISTRTVETHRMHLLRKFSAQNATEMIRIAMGKKIL
ncbi:MAG: response regulator transcription factor [Cytophagales bacterium]|nr:response regulator transcription factor [Cytophagales bacterium]